MTLNAGTRSATNNASASDDGRNENGTVKGHRPGSAWPRSMDSPVTGTPGCRLPGGRAAFCIPVFYRASQTVPAQERNDGPQRCRGLRAVSLKPRNWVGCRTQIRTLFTGAAPAGAEQVHDTDRPH